MRNMSFMLTTDQMYNRTKTVTRRLGWRFLMPGNVVMACEKCQGLKRGQRITRIYPVEIISTRWEPLNSITHADVIAEGFPDWTPAQFVDMFVRHNGSRRDVEVNRIEFREVKQ